MADGDRKDLEQDNRKEPNRRAIKDSAYAGQERRKGDRRKSPRII